MPYEKGQSLRERLAKEGELPVAEAVRILREMVDALAHAHENGIVHRDIKPDNVMLSGRHALVTDFGVAKAVSDATGRHKLTTEGIALGTPAYMAPEQAAADPHIDHRADIYAVGAVAYELLTGRPPFTGNTQQEILAAHVTQAADPVTKYRESVPPALAELVMKCLAKKPADRWQTAEELLPHLEALATPSGGITPTGMMPVRAAPKRRWVLAVATIAILAAIAAGVSYVVFGRSPEERPTMMVVVPLENRTGDPEADVWGELAADWITREMDRADFIGVAPSTTVRDMLRTLGGAGAVAVTTLAERLDATVAVAGTYVSTGGNIRFELEIVDAVSGQLLGTPDPVSGPVDSAEAVIATLAARAVGASMALVGTSATTWTSTMTLPPSREVFQEYSTATQLACEGKNDEALVHLERVFDLDSSFAPALMMAATAHYNSGRRREDDSLTSLVLPLRDRLLRSEQLWLDWSLAWNAGDLDAERRAAEDLFRMSPSAWGDVAGRTAIRNNRPAEAIVRYADYDWDDPCAQSMVSSWNLVAIANHMMGDFEAELEVARRARNLHPKSFSILDSEIRALAALGEVDLVDSLVAIAFTLPPNAAYSIGMRWVWAALEFKAHGHHDAYRNAIDKAVDWFQNRPPDQGSPYNLARSLYFAERFEEAYPIFDSLVTANPENVARITFLGSTAAHLGRRDQALEIDRRLEHTRIPYIEGAHTLGRAKIAAVMVDAERAMSLLHRALGEGVAYGNWLHTEPDFESLRDHPPFKELLRPKG